MFHLFGSNKKNKLLQDIIENDRKMEKYYLGKAFEYAKYAADSIDVDDMVAKFKDNLIGEHDSATINRIADTNAKYYRQGIEDVLKLIRS